MSHQEIVMFSNISEDVGAPYVALLNPKDFKAETEENDGLAPRHLLAYPDERITLVSPVDIDPRFIEYTQDLLNRDSAKVLRVPNKESYSISENILRNDEFLRRLEFIAARGIVASYCPSPQLFKLLDYLRNRGALLGTSNLPRQYSDGAFMDIGGKIGIRRLMDTQTHDPDIFHMPDGIVCGSRKKLIDTAVEMYSKWKGVVLKTQKGHAGAGVEICKPGEFKNAGQLKSHLEATLTQAYWSAMPSVCEKFIPVDSTIAGGFPNAEFTVLENGTPELTYFCGMNVNDKGVFAGVEMNASILSQENKEKVKRTGILVGRYLSSIGYRGKYEIDFIAGQDGVIYFGEVNVRFNGGSEVYSVSRHLFQDDLQNKVVISENNAPGVNRESLQSFADVHARLKPLLLNKSGEGIVITGAGLLDQGKIGYFVVGNTRDTALQLQKDMFDQLKRGSTRTRT